VKVIIQRVKEAKVEVNHQIKGQIKQGYLLYICFETNDSLKQLESAIRKIRDIRIFEDENRKMNRSIKDKELSILSISQFTLSWDGKKGNRPSFDKSMEPKKAKEFFDIFNQKLKNEKLHVETGIFAADMQVYSINDGPVTFYLSF
jgi:D-tyrosyl-tRNA(Tyr) deacylase